nr:hypothetical protein [Candidatus Kuenenia stuttgartiensis]
MSAKDIGEEYRRYFSDTLGRDKHCRLLHYSYNALALVLRDRLFGTLEKDPLCLS